MSWHEFHTFTSKIKCVLFNICCEISIKKKLKLFPLRTLAIQEICHIYNNLTAINQTLFEKSYIVNYL